MARLIRTLALSAAALVAAAAVLAAPTAATASPVNGTVSRADELPAGFTDTYEVELRGDEATALTVKVESGEVEVRVFGPSGRQLGDTMTASAGDPVSADVTPNATGKWKVKVTNKSGSAVKYSIRMA